jgi:hypothetical protein
MPVHCHGPVGISNIGRNPRLGSSYGDFLIKDMPKARRAPNFDQQARGGCEVAGGCNDSDRSQRLLSGCKAGGSRLRPALAPIRVRPWPTW